MFVPQLENITNIQSDDDPSKYLNNLANNSNSSPELIEYYDVDDASTAPDSIYPDPESIINQKLSENHPFDSSEPPLNSHRNGKNAATKFNKLQEINNPISGEMGGEMDNIKHVNAIEFDAMSNNANDPDTTFKGKSIDFNIRHTMEELKNEDLRDHDIIDNIMYIYYGSNVALRKSLGGSIIIVGTVFALAAQILAIVFTLLRNRYVNRFLLVLCVFFYLCVQSRNR